MFFFGSAAGILPYLCYFIAFWLLLFGNIFLSSKLRPFVSETLEKDADSEIILQSHLQHSHDNAVCYYVDFITREKYSSEFIVYTSVKSEPGYIIKFQSLFQNGCINDRAPPGNYC